MSIRKRIAKGVMALLPTGVFLTVQYAFIIFVMVLVTAFIAIGSPGMDAGALGQSASELLLGSVMDIQVIAQLLTLLVTAPWFFFAFVYKKNKIRILRVFRPDRLAGMVILSVGFYLVINCYMAVFEWALPGVMADYLELVEESGIAGLTLMSTIATLVLAPLGEEIVYRGLTLGYLGQTGMPFWAANILQAAAFGLVHMNWVQGGYAFLLGILLGYAYRKSGTLAAPIILHMLFNFCGTYLAGALDALPGGVWWTGILLIVMILCTAAGLWLTFRGPEWGNGQE